MSLDLSLPSDWRTWDEQSKDRLLARLKAESILQGKAEHYCTDATPSALARRIMGERWHHRAYHDVLDQMALDLDSGELDRGTISLPPQVGKSTWVNWFVVWWQARHPTEPIIRMSYAAELATSLARGVQSVIEQHGGQFGLLPLKRAWKQNAWTTLTGAGLLSGGMLTGIAGNPAALMIIDDPFAGRAWADSKVIRDKTWDEYSSSLLSRMRPKAPLLIVCTRWHEDDIVARALKLEGRESDGGRWREINLPAICWDAKDERDVPIPDALGRQIGDPLPHPWVDPADREAALKHWEDKRRTSRPRDWFSLYQGDPKPVEGALLTDEQVAAATWRGDLPEAIKTGVAVDPSGGGRDEAGIVGGQLDATGRVIWTHDRSGRMGSDEWPLVVCLLAFEIQANEIIYEHNYGGDQAKMLIRSQWKSLVEDPESPVEGMCPRIVDVNAKKAKRVRAEPVAQQVVLTNVMFWGIQILKVSGEWTTWQEDSKESPGRIDASSYLAYRWLKIPGAEAVVSMGTADTPKKGTGKGALASKRVLRPAAGR